MNKYLGGPALRTFFGIASRWSLTREQQMALLGITCLEEFGALEGGSTRISGDVLERISYLLGIYKAIHTLLPVPERADGWICATNTAPLFGGKSPLDLATSGNVGDLRVLRRYLDSQVGGEFL
jgi:hypothetical protein